MSFTSLKFFFLVPTGLPVNSIEQFEKLKLTWFTDIYLDNKQTVFVIGFRVVHILCHELCSFSEGGYNRKLWKFKFSNNDSTLVFLASLFNLDDLPICNLVSVVVLLSRVLSNSLSYPHFARF